jgi:phosphohistidine phosphatase SixA
MRDRVVPVAVSVLVIVLVAVVQERSRALAAVIATMPLTAPLALWIVFSASGGDRRETADFAGAMILGGVGSLAFILACWLGFRRGWGFALTLAVASALWLAIVATSHWAGCGSGGAGTARARSASALAGISLLLAPAAAADDAKDAWAALAAGGHVAMIRHGNAPPGRGGDPPGFRIDDCATQRNLDDTGRREARLLGEAIRKRSVRVDRVVSSPWCRCLDTAQLMAVGAAEKSWALVPDPEAGPPARLPELKALVSGWRGPGTLVLVTHALTVRPLTGFLPEQAETVVLKPTPGSGAGYVVVGRIAPPR